MLPSAFADVYVHESEYPFSIQHPSEWKVSAEDEWGGVNFDSDETGRNGMYVVLACSEYRGEDCGIAGEDYEELSFLKEDEQIWCNEVTLEEDYILCSDLKFLDEYAHQINGYRAFTVVESFEIYQDGKMLNQDASVRDYQEYLEKTILKLNYKSFTQIVILGSSTFVPFMQLTTANRREVIEDLLDISIFSAMSNLLKENMKEKKDQIKSLELKKSNLKEKIEMQQQFINELEQRGNSNIAEKNNKIDKLKKEINIYIEDNILNQKEIDLCTTEQEKVSGSKNTLVKLNNLKGKLSQKVSMITKEHKFFTENTVMPNGNKLASVFAVGFYVIGNFFKRYIR